MEVRAEEGSEEATMGTTATVSGLIALEMEPGGEPVSDCAT